MKQFLLISIVSSLVLTSASAFAQEEEKKTDGGDVDSLIDGAIGEEAPVVPAETPATTTPAEGDEKKKDEKAAEKKSSEEEGEPYTDDAYKELDPSDPLYWSTVRDVHTMQKRAFQKDGRLALSIYSGLIPNNIFENYVPLGFRLDYFILENIGIELASSFNLRVDTGLEGVIQENTGVAAEQVLLGVRQISHTNFGIVWSPFFGKTAFYDSALNYFDLYLFAGAGLVVTETVPTFNAEPSTDFAPEGAIGFGLSYYLGDHFMVRADFRQFLFQKVTGGVANPSEISLGLGYFL